MSRLLITANSPGEMAGWVRPILAQWRQRELGPVDILLLPCTFATGQEERVARSIPGVERVYRPHQFPRLLLSGGREYRDGNLLHLGGDLMYSAFLGWRWGIRCWSYLWARPWWDSAFRGYFTKDAWGANWLRKRKVREDKIHLTGDLVLDAVRRQVPHPSEEREFQVSYLPGSRALEAATLTPFFLGVHRKLQEEFPGLKGLLHLSPFLPREEVENLVQTPPDPKVGGLRGRLEGNVLRAEGTELSMAGDDHYHQLSRSRLVLSIPGTKTAEAGYLRTPLVCMLPLNRPEHLPSIGLTGLLDWIPGGRYLKGRLLVRLKGKIGPFAHPNILAGRELLPEIVDCVEVEATARTMAEHLRNEERLREVSESLQALYRWDSSPAAGLVDVIARG